MIREHTIDDLIDSLEQRYFPKEHKPTPLSSMGKAVRATRDFCLASKKRGTASGLSLSALLGLGLYVLPFSPTQGDSTSSSLIAGITSPFAAFGGFVTSGLLPLAVEPKLTNMFKAARALAGAIKEDFGFRSSYLARLREDEYRGLFEILNLDRPESHNIAAIYHFEMGRLEEGLMHARHVLEEMGGMVPTSRMFGKALGKFYQEHHQNIAKREARGLAPIERRLVKQRVAAESAFFRLGFDAEGSLEDLRAAVTLGGRNSPLQTDIHVLYTLSYAAVNPDHSGVAWRAFAEYLFESFDFEEHARFHGESRNDVFWWTESVFSEGSVVVKVGKPGESSIEREFESTFLFDEALPGKVTRINSFFRTEDDKEVLVFRNAGKHTLKDVAYTLAGDDARKKRLRRKVFSEAMGLLTKIHVAGDTLEREGRITLTPVANDYYTNRIGTTFADQLNEYAPTPILATSAATPILSPEDIAGLQEDYAPINRILFGAPTAYYKDHSLGNVILSWNAEMKVTDFEHNRRLACYLDRVSCLELVECLTDEEIEEQIVGVYSDVRDAVGISETRFLQEYYVASCHRHLEVTGYKARDFDKARRKYELTNTEEDRQAMDQQRDELFFHFERAKHRLDQIRNYVFFDHADRERLSSLRGRLERIDLSPYQAQEAAPTPRQF